MGPQGKVVRMQVEWWTLEQLEAMPADERERVLGRVAEAEVAGSASLPLAGEALSPRDETGEVEGILF
jgi:hypothetical protein